MGFRENLKDELKFQGILVKELAEKSGVAKGTIDHYLAEKCSAPIAENAVRIARALNVSVEYLVTGKELKAKSSPDNLDIPLCKKYYNLIKKLNSLSEGSITAIENLIENLK